MSSAQPIICVPKRTHRVFFLFAELSEFAVYYNSVRLSEFSSPKQYSRNSIPPVSYTWLVACGQTKPCYHRSVHASEG